MSIKIIKKSHHRNGCSGAGFDIILFKDGRNKMIAIDFGDDGYFAVFDKDLLDKDIIEFGENSYRGDIYQKELNKHLT